MGERFEGRQGDWHAPGFVRLTASFEAGSRRGLLFFEGGRRITGSSFEGAFSLLHLAPPARAHGAFSSTARPQSAYSKTVRRDVPAHP
jgi:hypothetical protein